MLHREQFSVSQRIVAISEILQRITDRNCKRAIKFSLHYVNSVEVGTTTRKRMRVYYME